jgi:septal ring factor EnvC (AmiA/AmiB activator)
LTFAIDLEMSELQEKELFQQLLQRDYNDLHVQKLSLQARLEITKNKLASAESEIAALREALAARAPVVNQVLPSRDDFPSTNNPQTTKQVTGAEEERHLNEAAYGQEPPRDVRMEG